MNRWYHDEQDVGSSAATSVSGVGQRSPVGALFLVSISMSFVFLQFYIKRSLRSAFDYLTLERCLSFLRGVASFSWPLELALVVRGLCPREPASLRWPVVV